MILSFLENVHEKTLGFMHKNKIFFVFEIKVF